MSTDLKPSSPDKVDDKLPVPAETGIAKAEQRHISNYERDHDIITNALRSKHNNLVKVFDDHTLDTYSIGESSGYQKGMEKGADVARARMVRSLVADIRKRQIEYEADQARAEERVRVELLTLTRAFLIAALQQKNEDVKSNIQELLNDPNPTLFTAVGYNEFADDLDFIVVADERILNCNNIFDRIDHSEADENPDEDVMLSYAMMKTIRDYISFLAISAQNYITDSELSFQPQVSVTLVFLSNPISASSIATMAADGYLVHNIDADDSVAEGK